MSLWFIYDNPSLLNLSPDTFKKYQARTNPLYGSVVMIHFKFRRIIILKIDTIF